jgi:hypothetical protein
MSDHTNEDIKSNTSTMCTFLLLILMASIGSCSFLASIDKQLGDLRNDLKFAYPATTEK